MLTSLRIQNLALVEDLAIELAPGFTVLTGETGAGKSLLVDALSLLVGARGDGDLVRQGTDRAVVEAVAEGGVTAWKAFLDDRGLPAEQPVVLRREVAAGGRSRAWVNGGACSLADLREAGRIWMRLTSQHDHQSLMAEERHLGLLDEVLGIRPDLGPETAAVKDAQARLARARLLVLPSVCIEGFPMVIREAYAAGVPVAASRLGPLPELVRDGVTGVLFEAGNPEDLRTRVAPAWSDQPRLSEMAQAARREFDARYTAEIGYRRLMEIYEEAIGARRERGKANGS